ncbi:MAG: hypothetical protein ACJ8F7_05075 [Gemmataceae bacterium]
MSDPHAASGRRPSTFRRLMVVGGVILLLLVAGGFALYHYQRNLDEQRLREAIALLDTRETAWRLEDIEAGRVVLADDQNSAVQILKIKKMLPASWPAPPAPTSAGTMPRSIDDRVSEFAPEVALPPELAEELRAELKAVQPAVLAARRLADLPQGRFPVTWAPDFISTILPCQEARVVGTLLRLDATLLVQDGQAESAVRSAVAILNCARAIGDEPLAISQLVRIALTHIAVATVERILAQGEPSPAALESLQRELEKELAEPVLVYMARGERAGQFRLYQGMMDGTASLSQVSGPSGGAFDRVADWQGAAMARRATPKMLRYMTEFVDAARLPAEQQRDRMKQIDPQIDPSSLDPGDILLRLFLPALDKIALASIRQQALLRCAVVGVAAERFRRGQNRWPASISELAPNYLPAVPLDPFDGKPLRWRKDPAGFTVYSVGYDGVDNGGNLDRKRMTQPGTDLGLRFWNASARRQVAEPLPMPRDESSIRGQPMDEDAPK